MNQQHTTNKMEKILGTIDHPVPCHGVSGERNYLDELAGSNGERIVYKREGSCSNPNGKDLLDRYELSSPDMESKYTVYMDMYSDKILKIKQYLD